MNIFEKAQQLRADKEKSARIEIKDNVQRIRNLDLTGFSKTVYELLESGKISVGNTEEENKKIREISAEFLGDIAEKEHGQYEISEKEMIEKIANGSYHFNASDQRRKEILAKVRKYKEEIK